VHPNGRSTKVASPPNRPLQPTAASLASLRLAPAPERRYVSQRDETWSGAE